MNTTKKKLRMMTDANRKRALLVILKRLKFIADRTEVGARQQALDRARAAVLSVVQSRT